MEGGGTGHTGNWQRERGEREQSREREWHGCRWRERAGRAPAEEPIAEEGEREGEERRGWGIKYISGP
jgi:hypothetical protein